MCINSCANVALTEFTAAQLPSTRYPFNTGTVWLCAKYYSTCGTFDVPCVNMSTSVLRMGHAGVNLHGHATRNLIVPATVLATRYLTCIGGYPRVPCTKYLAKSCRSAFPRACMTEARRGSRRRSVSTLASACPSPGTAACAVNWVLVPVPVL